MLDRVTLLNGPSIADGIPREATTDNKARTVATIKNLISAAGGSISRVLFNFVRKGEVVVRFNGKSFDDVVEQAIELGAEDVEEIGDSVFRVRKYDVRLADFR